MIVNENKQVNYISQQLGEPKEVYQAVAEITKRAAVYLEQTLSALQ